jgi:chromosomal replication initiator protein
MQQEHLWQAALGQLELRVSQGNFLTWFRGTHIIEVKDGVVVVETPSAFAHEWLSKKYHKSILEVLQGLDASVAAVHFTIHSQSKTQHPIKRNSRITAQKQRRAAPLVKKTAPLTPAITESSMPFINTLNPKYTFDSFVIGPTNEIAHAACQAVAAKPGDSYNPLFMYGGVGLGKTHLMQAIGNAIIKNNPQAKVLYVTSEKFMNDFVQGIRGGDVQSFKKQYRNIDVLMIDDLQFLAGKGKTQEELFHTYNTLYSQNKQIVLSSDRSPKALATFEERLRSRLTGGMLVDIQRPDYETRLAIVESKAQGTDVVIDPESLAYIAKNIQKNVRELEGALQRVVGYCEVNKQPASLEYTKKILEGVLDRPQQKSIDPQRVIEAVSVYYNLSLEELCGKRRKQEIVRPRQIAMYLLRKENNASFPAIGHQFGGRDHTTAMHACERITKLLEHDESLMQDINFIRERLYA